VIKLPGGEAYAVVGMVPHIRYMSPGDEESGFQAYFPYSQSSRADKVLLLRSKGDPVALTMDLRKVIASIDPNVAIGRTNTHEDVIAQRLVTRKLSLLLVSLFSGAALLLSAIGLCGILAYSVSQRTRDLGIRIALGARSSNILALVTRQALRLVGIGVVIGIVSALLLGHLIENVLYGVSATDPISLGISVIILGLAAFVACLLPALRATRINRSRH
jgi:ABC-type antimicrobial peptide transport system permease subunit